ncbi:tRNA_(guanine(37)-N1)-methyltransferase [Hexamita inflata]|uniref:tRNA (Guanine(37)-N1)-methyltransferase n=1 Tax=Hexamita inflata TaxID=28002 RepID=A0AA86TLF4_9EUKA|nr:tRNA (guanine(37)-N1)-methyltransferase [Hexamita inflata]CAI9978071.1 tRNA (guanine(37)-N1)-methyltransferase [Hexamita inflata]
MNIQVNPLCVKLCESLPVLSSVSAEVKQICTYSVKVNIIELAPSEIGSFLSSHQSELIKVQFPLLSNVYTYQALTELSTSPLPLQSQNKFVITYTQDGQHQITVPYVNLTRQQQLQLVMDNNNIPLSYEQIGHIAHYNLRTPVQLQFKNYIGLCTISKTISTVINKTESISNTFRTFPFELLAGAPNYIATTTQNGYKFVIDFENVYWNSRLEEEHKQLLNRIIESNLNKNEFVFDATGGVGPFAVPLGANKIHVLCNDLNEKSVEFMKINVNNNKVEQYVTCCNQDSFVLLKEILTTPFNNKQVKAVILNLPELSVDFLKAYRNTGSVFEPKFYIETFTRQKELFKEDIIARIVAARKGFGIIHIDLGIECENEECGCDQFKTEQLKTNISTLREWEGHFKCMDVRVVRDVGTFKWMVCAEVQFDEKDAFWHQRRDLK